MVLIHLIPYQVKAYGISDIGLVRQNNEDVWAQMPKDGFYILADGMGGHQAGEVAAREMTNLLCRIVHKKITPEKNSLSLSELKELLTRAIRHVNLQVHKMSRSNTELHGMGTTLCCLLFYENGLVIAHVGDSRIYRYRDQKLHQLTRDHSLLSELLDQGQLSEQQAAGFVYKNIITKAIGTESKVDPTVDHTEIQADDLYLMCSDGLSDLLSMGEIETILATTIDIPEALKKMVACANERGGKDNITAVITRVEQGSKT